MYGDLFMMLNLLSVFDASYCCNYGHCPYPHWSLRPFPRHPPSKVVDYTRSPSQDPCLFGPSPWKVLAATYEKKVPEQPSPWRKSCKQESCYGDQVYMTTIETHRWNRTPRPQPQKFSKLVFQMKYI